MPIALRCLGKTNPNAGQLVIDKSGSPPRCAGRSRSDFAENNVQIAVARKLQVLVVIATTLAAKFAVLVARSPCVSLKSPQAVPAGRSRGYIILCNITYITSRQFLVSISMRI